MEWIDKYGNLFSLLGLGLSVLTFLGVLWNKSLLRTLNKKNFKINRMPENLTDLKDISENISDFLTDFENNKTNIRSELSKIQPILKSLNKSLNKNETDNLSSLKNSIKTIDSWTYEGADLKWYQKLLNNKKEMTETLVKEVDIKLTRLITDIDNIGKDNKKKLL